MTFLVSIYFLGPWLTPLPTLDGVVFIPTNPCAQGFQFLFSQFIYMCVCVCVVLLYFIYIYICINSFFIFFSIIVHPSCAI